MALGPGTERRLLPLGPMLLHAIDGLVVALLPGLDEEGSDTWEGALNLLDQLASAVADAAALRRAAWVALQLSPTVRLAALNFLRLR